MIIVLQEFGVICETNVITFNSQVLCNILARKEFDIILCNLMIVYNFVLNDVAQIIISASSLLLLIILWEKMN